MSKFDFKIDVIKTDRKKSASIQLEGGLVKVRVPKSLSDDRINNLIKKRTPWIKIKLKEYSARPIAMPKRYLDGETFSYLGKNEEYLFILYEKQNFSDKYATRQNRFDST